jgi:hypothetical protein
VLDFIKKWVGYKSTRQNKLVRWRMPTIYQHYSSHITFQCGTLNTHPSHTQDWTSRAWSEWHDNRWTNRSRRDSNNILEFSIGSNSSIQKPVNKMRDAHHLWTLLKPIKIPVGLSTTLLAATFRSNYQIKEEGSIKDQNPFPSLLRQRKNVENTYLRTKGFIENTGKQIEISKPQTYRQHKFTLPDVY